MSEIVADCPRCSATKITFDLNASTVVNTRHNWQDWHEAFCVCRHCGKGTIFLLSDKGIPEGKIVTKLSLPKVPGTANDFVSIEGYITEKDRPSVSPPDHLPEDILAVFNEGATCAAASCFNAAGTMFRLCVDIATTSLVPSEDVDGLNNKIRRSLGLRLVWLFDTKRLPESLRDLSVCIKEDGNDGAHQGTLTQSDAEDLLDFTYVLLERLYTEPRLLEIAKERRNARRNQ